LFDSFKHESAPDKNPQAPYQPCGYCYLHSDEKTYKKISSVFGGNLSYQNVATKMIWPRLMLKNEPKKNLKIFIRILLYSYKIFTFVMATCDWPITKKKIKKKALEGPKIDMLLSPHLWPVI